MQARISAPTTSLDGSVGLSFRDASGKVRILLSVQPDGKSVLQFLDATGKVVNEFMGQKQ
jgi:hypothetical protein